MIVGKPTKYSKIQAAYDATSEGEIINIQDIYFNESLFIGGNL